MQRKLAVAGTLVVLLVSTFAMPVAASSSATGDQLEEPAIHIELESNGDATVSMVSVYDLTDEDERDAFETLQGDESTQAELLERFGDRLDEIATEIETNTAHEMTVTAESADVRTTGDRGIVTLSVSWEGLAATDGDTLTVTEPLASGFDLDRSLVVTVPADATIESATPDPTTQDDTRATWDAESDLDEFELTASLSDGTAESDDATDGVPGFSAGLALVAIIGITVSVVASRH